MAKALADKELKLIDAYWRAANYLSVGQIVERLLGVQAEIVSKGGNAQVVAADMRFEAERSRLIEQVRRVDILINNAGFGWYGYFNEMSSDTAREMGCRSISRLWCT